MDIIHIYIERESEKERESMWKREREREGGRIRWHKRSKIEMFENQSIIC